VGIFSIKHPNIKPSFFTFKTVSYLRKIELKSKLHPCRQIASIDDKIYKQDLLFKEY